MQVIVPFFAAHLTWTFPNTSKVTDTPCPKAAAVEAAMAEACVGCPCYHSAFSLQPRHAGLYAYSRSLPETELSELLVADPPNTGTLHAAESEVASSVTPPPSKRCDTRGMPAWGVPDTHGTSGSPFPVQPPQEAGTSPDMLLPLQTRPMLTCGGWQSEEGCRAGRGWLNSPLQCARNLGQHRRHECR